MSLTRERQWFTPRHMFHKLISIVAVSALLGAATAVSASAAPAPAIEISAEQWRTSEITLTASGDYDDPLTDVIVDAVFTSAAGTVMTRPAFWDGGSTWRVRFAPTETGTWTMSTVSSVPGDAGLNDITATVEVAEYSGDLEIYQRGFLRISEDGRHFEYADGTPFFYLGDTHWILPHERFDTSNAPDVASQFKYAVDTRVDQGFTVYQSEPIWQPHDEGVSDHDRDDEEQVANLRDGFDESDLPGFENMDRKFAYIADAGLVHANGQVTWAKDPAEFPDAFSEQFMADMGRYWVARYGSYPVIWTIAQEIDQNMYGAFTPETMAKWYAVGNAIAQNDAYHQVVMPHMENTSSSTASNSSWKDKPWHDAFGAQFQDWNMSDAKDFWNSSPAKPTVVYEAPYEDFWTDARGALSAGYIAFQLGMYGYGYGVSGVWNDAYSAPGETPDFGTDYELPGRYQWWYDGVNRETADQLTFLRDFYTARDWWKYEPRFDSAAWATLPSDSYLSSDGDDSFILLLADSNTTQANGTLNNLDPTAEYAVAWFNPRTGETTKAGTARSSLRGIWDVPSKPTAEDWLLTLDKGDHSIPDGNVAAGAQAQASSTLPGQDPHNATDGDLSTQWHACGGCGADEWWELDLAEETSFNTVMMAAEAPLQPAEIQFWHDGQWTVAATIGDKDGAQSFETVNFAPITTDRMRVLFTEGAVDPRISELALFDAPPATTGNLALQGTFSASSELDGNQVAARAFDDDEGTNWQACGGCWADQWLEVDLGTELQFDSVTVSEYDNRTSAYRIEYWNGTEWKTAYQGSGSFGDRIAKKIHFAPVVGSKVRIVYLEGTGYAPIVYEFGVYDSGTSALPVGDLAVGGAFSASSQWDAGQIADNAFDGRQGTNWQACDGCWTNEWLEVDFGAETAFDTMMVSEWASRTRDYVVEYWADEQWHLAYEGTEPFGDSTLAQLDFDEVTGTKARLRFLNGVDHAPIIYDLGFYHLGVADTAPPRVEVASDPAEPTGANGWHTSAVTLQFTATDDHDQAPSVEVSVNGEEFRPADDSLTLDKDGTYTVAVRSTDLAGNMSEVAEAEVKIDQTAPTATVEVGRFRLFATLTASDPTSGVKSVEYRYQLKVGNKKYTTEWGTYRSPLLRSILGNLTLEYRSMDQAGNISASKKE